MECVVTAWTGDEGIPSWRLLTWAFLACLFCCAKAVLFASHVLVPLLMAWHVQLHELHVLPNKVEPASGWYRCCVGLLGPAPQWALVLLFDGEQFYEAGCVEVILSFPAWHLYTVQVSQAYRRGANALNTFSFVSRLMPLLFQTLTCSLPNVALALAIMTFTSSSMVMFWESMLSR